MKLKEKVKNLPTTPGVYLMEDSRGTIIYVGKAKNLKNRVRSYFQNSKAHSKKIIKLKANIEDFHFIQTDTEFEALMLECKLIREIKPIFNRMMKNPQSYSYIMIQMDGSNKKIDITNSLEKEDCHYFGPFTSKRTVEIAVEGIKDFFKISCGNKTFKGTPCLNYSLGLCIGICFSQPALEHYKNIVGKILNLFNGTDMTILEEMNKKMMDATMKFDFESAAKYRDILDAIHSLINKEKMIEFTEANKNIIILETLHDNILKLFLVKGNKILFNEKYKMENLTQAQLAKKIQTNILTSFKDVMDESLEISRNDIDEAQIIYRYLKSSTCHYMVLTDYWFSIDLRSQINDFLSGTLRKSHCNQVPSLD